MPKACTVAKNSNKSKCTTNKFIATSMVVITFQGIP